MLGAAGTERSSAASSAAPCSLWTAAAQQQPASLLDLHSLPVLSPPPNHPPHCHHHQQFVNFKLYHSLGLRYPPVLDAKLEEAAAGLEALMQDLAGGSSGGEAAAAAKQLPEAGGGGEAGGEARGVNPQAEQRLGTLADKVRQGRGVWLRWNVPRVELRWALVCAAAPAQLPLSLPCPACQPCFPLSAFPPSPLPLVPWAGA